MIFSIFIILTVLCIWLAVISFFLFKTRRHYDQLVKRTGQKHLDEIMEHLLNAEERSLSDITKIKSNIQELELKHKHTYQKIGFLRFNPFEHITGDQSFIISLLDEEDTGIILNFLYTRDGIRVYAKKIKKGKSEEYELSSEEVEVIKKAL